MESINIFERIRCEDTDCPERIDCCTTVRWRISREDYDDRRFRDWWLLHEGARLYEEYGACYIQWPMRCKLVSDDGLRCTDYDNRPELCRRYVCRYMAGQPQEEDSNPSQSGV